MGLGFAELGTPAHNRDVERDDRYAHAIYRIAQGLTDPKHESTVLPKTLAFDDDVDRELRPGIAYHRIGATTYSLCTTFQTTSDESRDSLLENDAWAHPAGHHCYHFDRASEVPRNARPWRRLLVRMARRFTNAR